MTEEIQNLKEEIEKLTKEKWLYQKAFQEAMGLIRPEVSSLALTPFDIMKIIRLRELLKKI